MSSSSNRYRLQFAPLRVTLFEDQMRTTVDLVERIERLLSREGRRFEREASLRIERVPPERRSEFAEDLAADLDAIINESPRAFRSAHLIYAYSQFEHFMDSLARAVRRDRGIAADVGQTRGRGVRRAMAYLKKEAGIPVPQSAPAWSRILEIAEVRHCLTHNGGELPRDPAKREKLEKILARWGDEVKVGKHGRIALGFRMVPECVELFMGFARELRKVILKS